VRIALLLLPVLTLAVTTCATTSEPTGTLQGKVHIVLLSPVEMPGGKPPVNPEVFAARKVMVNSRDGRKLIAQVSIEQTGQGNEGFYRAPLKPGVYAVDITRLGINRSREVPRQIEIMSEQTTEVNIDIDAGIR